MGRGSQATDRHFCKQLTENQRSISLVLEREEEVVGGINFVGQIGRILSSRHASSPLPLRRVITSASQKSFSNCSDRRGIRAAALRPRQASPEALRHSQGGEVLLGRGERILSLSLQLPPPPFPFALASRDENRVPFR